MKRLMMDIKGPNDCSFPPHDPWIMNQYFGQQKFLFCTKSEKGAPCRVSIGVPTYGPYRHAEVNKVRHLAAKHGKGKR